MFDEIFWIFLSFVGFIGISFSFVRRSVTSAIDKKIQAVEKSIHDAEAENAAAHQILVNLKEDYENLIKTASVTIEQSKNEAASIISEAEERIANLNLKSDEIFEDYKKRSENQMIDSLKTEVVITVLSMIESDIDSLNNNPTEQLKNIENSRKVLKKLWN
jgi:F0F1-type ATP synthase membrane subunit b/b'